MPKHTEAEMEQLSLDDLKKLADDPEPEPEAKAQPRDESGRFVAAEDDEQETFVARREVDLQDGSGVQVYEATGESREAALSLGRQNCRCSSSCDEEDSPAR